MNIEGSYFSMTVYGFEILGQSDGLERKFSHAKARRREVFSTVARAAAPFHDVLRLWSVFKSIDDTGDAGLHQFFSKVHQ